MVILETPTFSWQIDGLMDANSYRELQNELISRPDVGKLIQGSGGLRKIRWRANSRGKRGGSRIIYYWAVSEEQIYMLLAYGKNRSADLTQQQIAMLKDIVEQEFKNE